MSKIPQWICNAYRNCQRLFWEKTFFWTFFGNFDFEISKFCHSDTLKNEIPWTLTNDKIFFSSRTVPKNFFLTYYKHRPFNHTNSQGHTTSRKVAKSLFRKKSSATWGLKVTAFTFQTLAHVEDEILLIDLVITLYLSRSWIMLVLFF